MLLNRTVNLTSTLVIDKPVLIDTIAAHSATRRKLQSSASSATIWSELAHLNGDGETRLAYVTPGTTGVIIKVSLAGAILPMVPCETPFDCGGAALFIGAEAAVTLYGMTIASSHAYMGAGVYAEDGATLTAVGVRLQNNYAVDGESSDVRGDRRVRAASDLNLPKK